MNLTIYDLIRTTLYIYIYITSSNLSSVVDDATNDWHFSHGACTSCDRRTKISDEHDVFTQQVLLLSLKYGTAISASYTSSTATGRTTTTTTMPPFRSTMNYGALRDPVFAANTEGNVYAPATKLNHHGANHHNMEQDDEDIIDHTNHGVTAVPMQHSFSPYEMNGGTVAAVAGPNYCIIASDTRCSAGYEILSRNVSHIHTFSNQNVVLASSGCKTDIDQLRSVLDIRCKVRLFAVSFRPFFG